MSHIRAFIVTEDYNRLGRYQYTAFSSREAADKHAEGVPGGAAAYAVSRGDLAELAEVHVQVHEVAWPEENGKPAALAEVMALSEQDGFSMELFVDCEPPRREGWTLVCPEDPQTWDLAGLVLDGPTLEGGDTYL
jgi:hypothetical protein